MENANLGLQRGGLGDLRGREQEVADAEARGARPVVVILWRAAT
jgi:hypothetical protein